jgi:hypothetical protein
MNSVQRKVLMHGGGLLSRIARRRVLIEPRMVVRSPRFGVNVVENIVEDRILGKKTMSLAIEVLISRIVERCQLIFCYGPFSDNLSPKKVIMSQTEDSREVHDTYTESVTFNAKVDGGLIPISTSPSSGIEQSYQLCVPILIQAKDIKYYKRVSLGNDLVKHWITLVLHIGPFHIELWG